MIYDIYAHHQIKLIIQVVSITRAEKCMIYNHLIINYARYQISKIDFISFHSIKNKKIKQFVFIYYTYTNMI